MEWWVKGSAEEVGWASFQADVARLDCLMAKNQLEVHLQRLIELSTISHGYTATRIIILPSPVSLWDLHSGRAMGIGLTWRKNFWQWSGLTSYTEGDMLSV
jgi:hypothetical protein